MKIEPFSIAGVSKLDPIFPILHLGIFDLAPELLALLLHDQARMQVQKFLNLLLEHGGVAAKVVLQDVVVSQVVGVTSCELGYEVGLVLVFPVWRCGDQGLEVGRTLVPLGRYPLGNGFVYLCLLDGVYLVEPIVQGLHNFSVRLVLLPQLLVTFLLFRSFLHEDLAFFPRYF